MIKFKLRLAKLGGSINLRTEMDGDEPVGGVDIPIKDLLITAAEFNDLVNDPYADRAVFTKEKGLKSPSMPYFSAFRLKEKFEGASVEIRLGPTANAPVVEIDDVKLSKITIEPKTGGNLAVNLTLQASPEAKDVGKLFDHMDREIQISIVDAQRVDPKAKDKQQELGLGGGGPSDAAVDDDKPARRRKGSNAESRPH